MKLSLKIPLLIGLLVLATSAALGLLALRTSSRALTDSVIGALHAENEANAKLMGSILNREYSVLYEIGNSALVRTMDWEAVQPILLDEVSRIEAQQIALSLPDGSWRSATTGLTTNVRDRNYFIKAMAGEPGIEIVIGRVTGTPVLVMAVPIYQSNASGAPIIGVLSAEKDGIDHLTDIMLENLKVSMPSGYCFMMETASGQAVTIAHPDKSLVISRFNPEEEARTNSSLASLGAMLARSRSERNGEAGYTSNGKRYISYFNELPFYPNWILYSSIESVDIDNQLAGMRNAIFLAGIISIITGIVVAFLIGRSITKPVTRVAHTLKDIAEGEGDLTAAINIKSKDEIGDLAHYFNQTIGKIKSLVINIKKESGTLSDIASSLSSNMNDTARAINKITDNIKHVKERIQNQSISVSETHETMEQFVANINVLNSHIEDQSNNVSQASSAVEEMVANINSVASTLINNAANVNALKGASEISRTSLQEVASDIQEIAKESEGLLEINSVMENIASQTNLLSMNAAIEAAHAGESGKGFAVVAGEIRKLAENSSAQSKTISTVLKKIKSSIDKITQSTENVLNNFGDIDTSIKTVSDQEENIRGVMEEQGRGSKQILQAIGQVNELTRRVKDGSHEMLEGAKEVIHESGSLDKATLEITSGMNEMTIDADQINDAVNHVNEISGKNRDGINVLLREVSRFKVG